MVELTGCDPALSEKGNVNSNVCSFKQQLTALSEGTLYLVSSCLVLFSCVFNLGYLERAKCYKETVVQISYLKKDNSLGEIVEILNVVLKWLLGITGQGDWTGCLIESPSKAFLVFF